MIAPGAIGGFVCVVFFDRWSSAGLCRVGPPLQRPRALALPPAGTDRDRRRGTRARRRGRAATEVTRGRVAECDGAGPGTAVILESYRPVGGMANGRSRAASGRERGPSSFGTRYRVALSASDGVTGRTRVSRWHTDLTGRCNWTPGIPDLGGDQKVVIPSSTGKPRTTNREECRGSRGDGTSEPRRIAGRRVRHRVFRLPRARGRTWSRRRAGVPSPKAPNTDIRRPSGHCVKIVESGVPGGNEPLKKGSRGSRPSRAVHGTSGRGVRRRGVLPGGPGGCG